MIVPSIGIGFDFDHTLGLDHGLELRALYDYAAELDRPLDEDDPELRAAMTTLLADFRAGMLTLESFVLVFAEQLGERGDPDRWRELCYGLVDQLVVPVDGAREMLVRLRERAIPVAVLTNGWTPLQQKKIARALGDAADGVTVLVSDALGAIKPAAAAFDALVATLGVAREHAWYVGDNPPADVAGALAAGLRAVWFDWEGSSYPQDLPPPTLRIAALRELETLGENTYAP
ncbi:MAG TPA: HAD family hydrolase [Candidatus Elarobacter sp.]|nr:HAD family hydrolase [Candidatus Elarobacter sp.]